MFICLLCRFLYTILFIKTRYLNVWFKTKNKKKKKSSRLSLNDFVCLQRFRSITRQILHKAQAFLLMYDVTSTQSFSAVSFWANHIQVRYIYTSVATIYAVVVLFLMFFFSLLNKCLYDTLIFSLRQTVKRYGWTPQDPWLRIHTNFDPDCIHSSCICFTSPLSFMLPPFFSSFLFEFSCSVVISANNLVNNHS